MVIVDLPDPTVRMVRPLSVFGYDDAPHGHMEIEFRDTQVAKSNLIWEEGKGFEIAQGFVNKIIINKTKDDLEEEDFTTAWG